MEKLPDDCEIRDGVVYCKSKRNPSRNQEGVNGDSSENVVNAQGSGAYIEQNNKMNKANRTSVC